MQGDIQQELRWKILDLGCFVLLHLAYSLEIAQNDFPLFRSQQNALNVKKISQEDQVKRLWKDFWVRNQLNFTQEENNRQERIQNNGNLFYWLKLIHC